MINRDNRAAHYFDQYAAGGFSVKSTYYTIGRNLPGVLYEPEGNSRKSGLCILIMHSDISYLDFEFGPRIAAWGYRVLCANVSSGDAPLDQKILDVGQCVGFARGLPGVDTLVLLGHSGGASLMSAYQAIAENGPEIFQGPEKIVPCSDRLAGLPAADAVMFLDSNWGNGAMRVFSLDPAVTEDDNGVTLDPELSLFEERNGFTPGGTSYSDAFIRKFQQAQGQRNNRLTAYALSRVKAIESGEGKYRDDEPMIIAGASQAFFNNKLFAQDIRLLSRTRKPWPLLHGDGTITTEIVYSVRKPENDFSLTDSYERGSLPTTVRKYLSNYALRTTEDYGFNEDSVFGIDWDSSYNCTPGNVSGIRVPILILGMTASWEYSAAETIAERAGSQDVTLAYVEGAQHFFNTAKDREQFPGQFGDTMQTTCRFVDAWLRDKFGKE